MFTDTSFGEDIGGIKDASLMIDLGLDIGKLSVSRTPYRSSCVAADISSLSMVESHVSGADILSAIDSICVRESPEQMDGVGPDIKADTSDSIAQPFLSRQCSHDGQDIAKFDSCDFADVAEPSAQGDVEARDLVVIDKTCVQSHSLIVYTSSRRKSVRNTKPSQKKESSKPSTCRHVVNKCSEFDLSSLKILRKSRSSYAKRARAFVWGDLGNILPGIEKNSKMDQSLGDEKKRRSGKGKRKGTKDQAGKKSKGKSVIPTGHISLKVKIGNKLCFPGTFENLNASQKDVSESIDKKEIRLGDKVLGDTVSPSETNLEKVISSDGSALSMHLQVRDTCYTQSFDASSNFHKIRSLEEGDRLRGLTEIQCSDVGTSPDSEVINSVPDVLHCEKGLPDLQDGTIVSKILDSPTVIPNLILSPKHLKKGKKKVKLPQVDNCMLGNKQTGAGTRNNATVPAPVKDVSSLSSPRTESKKGRKEGNETTFDHGVTGALSNGVTEPINKMQFLSHGSSEQYDPRRNAWVLCDECQKWRRIPATLADQIEETNCGWTCQDNTDKDFADCSIPQEKSDSDINDELGISDGSCGEDSCGAFLKSDEDRSNDAQQSSWTLIKSNLFLHRSRKNQTIDEVMVCHCKPPSDGRMGCGANCLNRILNIECVQGTCPCGELCSNQQFQKRKYAKLKWFRCGKKGYGLKAVERIPEGQFLIEYVGEVLDVNAYEARQREYSMTGHRHFYFMTLNGSEVIDACAKGNLGRFINHSCDPNCRTEKWMVNGEVCIGLFSLRDIKKGEEVTFDYNFVRVFGAAAKKCVCGSANCRGYIGGDLTNSEVIAQDDSDDEYTEPVMTCEDREMIEDWNFIMLNNSNDREDEIANEPSQDIYSMKKLIGTVGESSITSCVTEPSLKRVEGVNSGQGAEIRVGDGFGIYDSIDNRSSGDFDELNNNKTTDKPTKESTVAGLKVESVALQSRRLKSSHVMDSTLQLDGIVNKAMSSAHESAVSASHSKSLSDKVQHKRNIKYASVEGRDGLAKANSLSRTNHSSSTKKGKPKLNALKDKVYLDMDNISLELHKSKKFTKPLNHHFEAVEEKLNELLDPEGGISKRKDASKGYLKLLFLTAATGNNGGGEAIQSNRDLSMILDALLKTKSRTVLVDIFNKNGLQMLHNIMKRYRKEFIKTPILRKLLKVLEYLATREILTLEHITGGPPCLGVESFKDSVLTLAEHVDRQVHQIARNFRDKWIPRSLRSYCCMERDDGIVEYHQPSGHGGSSVSYDCLSDRGGKSSEAPNSTGTELVAVSGTARTSTIEIPGSASNCRTNEPKTRKRKSRWDNPAEHPHSRGRSNSVGDDKHNVDDDIPPGFSNPGNGPMIPSDVSSTAANHQEREMLAKVCSNIVSGDPQLRFIARMPISYGIPNIVMQQFRVPRAEISKVWTVAPGVPFHPFPPLPPFAPGELDQPSSARCASSSAPTEKAGQFVDTCTTYQTDPQNTKTCSMDSSEKNASVAKGRPDFQQGGSCSLGRKYFRQQKWTPSKLPPWVRIRNGWGPA